VTREEAAREAISEAFLDHSYDVWPDMENEAKAALAAADAHDAAHNVHRLVIDDATVERAAHVLYEHREDALTCYDHDNGWCCICGEHDIGIPWFEHAVRAVLESAVREPTP
jgi:hypothetical protein